MCSERPLVEICCFIGWQRAASHPGRCPLRCQRPCGPVAEDGYRRNAGRGPRCSHRPLERNLAALGIVPSLAFLMLPASRCFEGLSGGAQAGLRSLGTPPCSGPWKLLDACWVVRVSLFSKGEDCLGASQEIRKKNYTHITKQDNTRFAASK